MVKIASFMLVIFLFIFRKKKSLSLNSKILVRRRSPIKKNNLVHFLLKKNVNLCLQNKDGETALDLSLECPNTTILNLILNKLSQKQIDAMNIERTLILCATKGKLFSDQFN
jgi:ankyrin repeat protein